MFVAVAVAGLAVDGLFSAAGLIPSHRPSVASISERAVTWNYTSVLDVMFAVLFVALIALSLRRGTKDPVCGMAVDRGGPTTTVAGRTYVFCGPSCKPAFDAAPGLYAGRA
jgi:YHS domain-containing protein